LYLNFKSSNYKIKTNEAAGIASSVGIVTSYGMDGWEFLLRWGPDFPD